MKKTTADITGQNNEQLINERQVNEVMRGVTAVTTKFSKIATYTYNIINQSINQLT